MTTLFEAVGINPASRTFKLPVFLPFAYTAFISVVDGEIIETLEEKVLSASLDYDLSEEVGPSSILEEYAYDVLKETYKDKLVDTVYRVFLAGEMRYSPHEDWETGIVEYEPEPHCQISLAEFASHRDIEVLNFMLDEPSPANAE